METSRHQRQRWEIFRPVNFFFLSLDCCYCWWALLGISKTCFPDLLQFLDCSYPKFFFVVIVFERGGKGWRGRPWIPCVGRYVYLQFMWGLVGNYSAKKDAPLLMEREARGPSWEGTGEDSRSLVNLSWLHLCTHVQVYVDVETNCKDLAGWLFSFTVSEN